jgi:hypothetical protein
MRDEEEKSRSGKRRNYRECEKWSTRKRQKKKKIEEERRKGI